MALYDPGEQRMIRWGPGGRDQPRCPTPATGREGYPSRHPLCHAPVPSPRAGQPLPLRTPLPAPSCPAWLPTQLSTSRRLSAGKEAHPLLLGFLLRSQGVWQRARGAAASHGTARSSPCPGLRVSNLPWPLTRGLWHAALCRSARGGQGPAQLPPDPECHRGSVALCKGPQAGVPPAPMSWPPTGQAGLATSCCWGQPGWASAGAVTGTTGGTRGLRGGSGQGRAVPCPWPKCSSPCCGVCLGAACRQPLPSRTPPL